MNSLLVIGDAPTLLPEHPQSTETQTNIPMKTARKMPQIRCARSYVFFRADHDWHGREVFVLGRVKDKFRVALVDDISQALQTRQPLTATISATSKELW